MKASEKIINYSLVLAWCAIIFFLSNQPKISTVDSYIFDFAIKKIAHFTEYFILAVLVYRATRKVKVSIIFCILFAASDELHQSFVPGREPHLRDVIIDAVGSVSGVILWNKLLPQVRQKPKK